MLSKFCFSKPCFSASENSAENKSVLSFLLFSLCQKNRRTNRLNSFVSPLSLSKRIQRTNRLRILLILPFPLNKRSQRTNCLRLLLFPLTKIQRNNRLRILCPNTLEGTSTWGLLNREQERVHLLWISSNGGYIHLVFQRRVHPLWIFGL